MSSCPSSLTTSTEGQHQPAGPASGPPPCEEPQRGALLGCLLLEPHPVMMENLGKSILCLRACSSGKNAMDWGQKSLRGCSPMSIPFSVASPSPDLGWQRCPQVLPYWPLQAHPGCVSSLQLPGLCPATSLNVSQRLALYSLPSGPSHMLFPFADTPFPAPALPCSNPTAVLASVGGIPGGLTLGLRSRWGAWSCAPGSLTPSLLASFSLTCQLCRDIWPGCATLLSPQGLHVTAGW